jgi:hypothetical protein
MVTEFSCQGDRDEQAHICFARAADAWRFMEAPGDFVITVGESRAWVDFSADRIGELTQYWATGLSVYSARSAPPDRRRDV